MTPKPSWFLVAFLANACGVHAQTSALPSGESPLAAIDDRKFTAAEVDARWKADTPGQQARVLQMLYDGRRDALEALIADYLLDRAASAKGVHREQYEDEEIAFRAKRVSDAEVAAFYEANRSDVQGRSLEEMRPILREYLEDRRRTEARQELIASLKAADPGVRVFLDAPRAVLPITADDPADGPAAAPVTIVEFADFECPFCQQFSSTLRRVREKYGDRVRLVWKDFPLTGLHPRAFQSAVAARCAMDQGKFWEYHDRLFTGQKAAQFSNLKLYAADVRLDVPRFSECVESSKHARLVEQGMNLAARLGLSSTPTTFINGRMVIGAEPFEALAAVVEEELQRIPER